MELRRRQLLLIVAATAALAAVSGMASAQINRQLIRLVVGFAPGSSVDIIARLMTDQINKAQGMTMVVENQPGAGTLIATEAAARAAPNGSALLITSPPFVINPNLPKSELRSTD